MIVTLNSNGANTTAVLESTHDRGGTHSYVSDRGLRSPSDAAKGPYGIRPRTNPQVDRNELVDDEAHDQMNEYATRQVVAQQTTSIDPIASRLRSELAREIRTRIDDLIEHVGHISLPTRIQVLLKYLSKCHDSLDRSPSETDFLSIVSLFEATLSQKRWRDYTADDFSVIRRAVSIAYEKPEVGFDDYDQIRKSLSERGLSGNPLMEIEQSDWDLLGYDEEEEDEIEGIH